jgi:hypothetical protein
MRKGRKKEEGKKTYFLSHFFLAGRKKVCGLSNTKKPFLMEVTTGETAADVPQEERPLGEWDCKANDIITFQLGTLSPQFFWVG